MAVRTILVGVADLDHDPVLPAAVELARRAGAELHAVYSFEIHHLVMRAHHVLGMREPDTRKFYEWKLREQLEAQMRRLSDSPALHSRAVCEPAGDAIVSVADDVGADLIVVGATRQGPVMRQILGSTADRVIRTSRVPVLVMRPPFTTTFQRILLTTDRSSLSAVALARGADVGLHVGPPEQPEVRCVEVTSVGGWAATPIPPHVLEQEEHAELASFLASLALPFEQVEPRVRLGDPAKEIAAEAAEWNADLIITGTRGRAGVSRFLLGSVAGSILRTALCDILVVPTPEGAAGMVPPGTGNPAPAAR